MSDFHSDNTAAIKDLEGLFVPANDRELRQVQRRTEELDKQVRSWAEAVIRILPRGLPINSHEVYVLSLFLAQQRRLNLQMDAHEPDESFIGWLKSSVGFLSPKLDTGVESTAHRVVSGKLDSEIDRAVSYYCREHGVSPDRDESLDWRVAIRFMAQSIFSRLTDTEPKKMAQSPRRFELALVSRDLASGIQAKRQVLSSVAPTPVA